MYTTSLKTWARAVAVDGILIAALVAGVIFAVPHILQVSVFFMWWLSAIGIVMGLLALTLPLAVESLIQSLERDIALLDPDSDKTKELQARVKKAKDSVHRVWSDKLVDKLAVSTPYLVYHWATDVAVWVLLVIAGHPILATFKVASFLISCIAIGVARKLYRERHGLPDPDEASASTAHK